MSNHAHHRPRTERADRGLIDLAIAMSGCTCRPDLRHISANHTRAEHDPDCPAADHASQYVLGKPRKDNT